MTNGKDDVSDPIQKLYAALDEDMAGPGGEESCFQARPARYTRPEIDPKALVVTRS